MPLKPSRSFAAQLAMLVRSPPAVAFMTRGFCAGLKCELALGGGWRGCRRQHDFCAGAKRGQGRLTIPGRSDPYWIGMIGFDLTHFGPVSSDPI